MDLKPMVAMEPWRWKWLWEPSVHLALLQGPSSPHLLKALPVTPAPSAHHPWELQVNCVSCSVVYMGSVCVCVCVCVCLSHSVVSDSLRPHGLYPARLLHPWDSSDKNTGVGCHSLLQGIFPTQELNPGLLHCGQIL